MVTSAMKNLRISILGQHLLVWQLRWHPIVPGGEKLEKPKGSTIRIRFHSMGNQGLQNIIKHPMVWDCLGHMSPQSQNPEHSSAVAIIGYRFFGGPISLSSVLRLRHCRFLGGPIALQCFVHISDKSAFAILQWLPF